MKPNSRERTSTQALFVLSFPPPYHGANISNETVRDSSLAERFAARIVDISDPRDQENLGRIDLMNVIVGLRAVAATLRWGLVCRPRLVYLLVSSNTPAFLRDAMMILAAKVSGAAVVGHLMVDDFDEYHDKCGALMRRCIAFGLRRLDAGIVSGEGLRHNWSRWVERLYAVANGTDVCLSTDVPTKWRDRRSRPVITYMSSLSASKGILDFLRASAVVARAHPNVEFRVAGNWVSDPLTNVSAERLRAEAMELLETHPDRDRVRLLGTVTGSSRDALLQESDVFVLPTSWSEAQPFSILEAMAGGCVVIATPRGSIPEVVVDGETGFLVEPGHPEEIVARIEQLLSDPEMRARMGRAARARYEALYTAEKYTERLGSVFDAVLDRRTT